MKDGSDVLRKDPSSRGGITPTATYGVAALLEMVLPLAGVKRTHTRTHTQRMKRPRLPFGEYKG